MKTKSIVMFVILAVGATGVGLWLWMRPAAPAVTEEVAPVALVKTAILKERALVSHVDAWGVVAPSVEGTRIVTAPFDGIVAKVLAVSGDRVAAGARLIELAPSADAKFQLDDARVTLRLAERTLATVKARYDLKLATDTELIAAQQAEAAAHLKVASLETRGLGSAGGVGSVVAPAAGVVSRVDVAVGAAVTTGAPLAVVVTSAGLEAKLGVELDVVGKVTAGERVVLVSLDRPGLAAVEGHVVAVGASADAATGEVAVRVTLPDGAALLAGEHLRARIETGELRALAVPRAAVLPEGDAEVIFTVKDGKAVRHEVTAGIADGDWIEVSGGGVASGDGVVTVGNHELSDGMAVRTDAEGGQ